MAELCIVIPVYNCSRYIGQCVESILNQTFKDIEVLIIDDGSTDGSGDICDQYGQRDNRISVIHQPNSGSVAARNTGISAAKSKYIAFVDADDWIEANMYELMMNTVKQGYDVVVCDFFLDYARRQERFANRLLYRTIDGRPCLQIIDMENFFKFLISPVLWNKVFVRERLLTIAAGVDNRITVGDDASIVIPYLINARSVGHVSENLYHYRQLKTSMTHIHNRKSIESLSVLLDYFGKIYTELNQGYQQQIDWYDYFMVIYILKTESLSDRPIFSLHKFILDLYCDGQIGRTLSNTKIKTTNGLHYAMNVTLRHKQIWFSVALLIVWKIHIKLKMKIMY